MKRYFEFKDDKSNKFWEIALEGASLTTRYGKIGAQGQTTTKTFDSEAEAKKEYDSLVREKTKKGYQEVGTDVHTTSDGGWMSLTSALSEKDAIKLFLPYKNTFEEAEQNEEVDGAIDLESYVSGTERRLYDGDLILDELHLEAECPSLFVKGDLTVKGLLKQDFNSGALVVLGNLEAQSIVTTSQMVVMGSLTVHNTIYGNCTNYSTDVFGLTVAKVLISAMEHYFCLYGGREIDVIVDVYGDTPNLDDRNLEGKDPLAVDDPYSEEEAASILRTGHSLLRSETAMNSTEENIMKQYLEFKDSKSSKFWEILLEGTTLTTRYGKIGAQGQTTTKSFDSEAEAKKEYDALIREKTKKGYKAMGEDSGKEEKGGILSVDQFEIVSFDDVAEKYSLEEYLMGGYESFRRYDGNLEINGDLRLDDLDDDEEGGILVTGNLVVNGTISNTEGMPFLVVLGDTKAKSLLAGDSEIVFVGNLNVEKTVFAHYNDGILRVDGDLKAEVILNPDHCIRPRGKVEAITIGIPFEENDCEIAFDDEKEIVLNELFSAEGYLDNGKVFEYIEAGRDIIRKGAKTKKNKALEKLDELIKSGKQPTKLDLSEKKLTEFPIQVTELVSLEELILSDNKIKTIPGAIGKLKNLKRLELHQCELDSIPAEIGELTNLERFDLSENKCAIPDSIGKLKNLKSLNLNYTTSPLPDSLKELENLEELSLRGHSGIRRKEFPSVVAKIKNLKKLDLSGNPFQEIPSAISDLSKLEKLNLDDSLGYLSSIPDLLPLKELKALNFDGKMMGAFDQEEDDPKPKIELLWSLLKMDLPSLECLSIDRWGERLTALPDEIGNFANLKVIDLSFNDLKELPEGFYRLKKLESISLEYCGKLSRKCVDRLIKEYPRTKIDLRNVKAAQNPENPEFQQVKDAVKKANELRGNGKYDKAIKSYRDAIKLAQKTKKYSEYDYLYAHYGIMFCYSRGLILSEDDREKKIQHMTEFIGIAKETLPLIDYPIWHFTEMGAFQEEVLREAYNGLGWYLYQLTPVGETESLEVALAYAEKGAELVSNSQHYFIFDTQVRILLTLGRDEEAYQIVERVLNEDKNFGDFQDIKKSKKYQKYLERK